MRDLDLIYILPSANALIVWDSPLVRYSIEIPCMSRDSVVTDYSHVANHFFLKTIPAKYNSAGQLTCILCSSVVKNELVWPAHVNGKLHKENVANLKSAKSPAVSAGKTNGVKR